jgi:hypothetical protein
MKNNLILFGILLTLVIGTYFFQEKKDRDHELELSEEQTLIKEPISFISWDGKVTTKVGKTWRSGDQLLSAIHMGKIENSLNSLKKIKKIEGDITKIFNSPFELKINGRNYLFGTVTLDQQGFYLAQDKEVYIVTFDQEILHSEDENPQQKKLNEFLNLFSQDQETFKEKQFFRYYSDLDFTKIKLQTDGSITYELDFQENKTIPMPIAGIQVHENLKAKFLSLFTQVMIKDQVQYPKTKFFKKMSDLTFFKSNQTQLKLELWLKNKSNADAIILDPINQKAFEMVGGSLRTFFVQIQDYWDKKVIPPSSFKSFNEVEAIFFQDKHELKLKVLNREPLIFESDRSLQEDELRVLFTYIFNLGEKDQADRVSQISSTDRQILEQEKLLKIVVFGQELYILKKQEEVIVMNTTQGFKAHFGLVDEKFPVGLKDVLR